MIGLRSAAVVVLRAPLIVVRSLVAPPRAIGDALEDIRSMARSVETLPQVAARLADIERCVTSLDDEVRVMRQSVQSIHGDLAGVESSVAPLERQFAGVQRAVDPLGDELEQVRGAIARLEVPLVEVRDSVGPLQPTAERLGQVLERLPGARRRQARADRDLETSAENGAAPADGEPPA